MYWWLNVQWAAQWQIFHLWLSGSNITSTFFKPVKPKLYVSICPSRTTRTLLKFLSVMMYLCFYAFVSCCTERHTSGSNFRMTTSLALGARVINSPISATIAWNSNALVGGSQSLVQTQTLDPSLANYVQPYQYMGLYQTDNKTVQLTLTISVISTNVTIIDCWDTGYPVGTIPTVSNNNLLTATPGQTATPRLYVAQSYNFVACNTNYTTLSVNITFPSTFPTSRTNTTLLCAARNSVSLYSNFANATLLIPVVLAPTNTAPVAIIT